MTSGDRIKENASVSGSGSTVTLSGAVASYQPFSSVFTNGQTGTICIVNVTTGEWEICTATFNSGPNTLTRGTVKTSSSSNGTVTFSAGTFVVFNTQSATEFSTTGSTGKIPVGVSGALDPTWIPAPTTTTLGGLKALASATSHNFVTYIDNTGIQNLAQPGVGDLANIAAYTYVGNTTSASAAPASNTVLTLGTPSGTFAAPGGSVLGQLTSSTNQYAQLCIQNTNSGSSASSDFVATADTGTDASKYIDIGINNSAGSATPFTTALACYVYTDQAELDIGALGTSGIVNIYAGGGTSTPTKAIAISGTASTFSGQIVTALAGASSAPAVKITGNAYTGGNGTTNLPQLYINNGASSPTTLSANGTQIGVNATSGFTGNFLDLRINGGSSLLYLDYLGQIFATNLKTTGSGGIAQFGYWNNGDGSFTALTCLSGSTALFMSGATNPILNFSASTSSGVGLRRNNTTLEVKLGDNSAFASITALNVKGYPPTFDITSYTYFGGA